MGLPGRSTTCTPRKLLNAISRMRCDHKRYGGTVMFFPDLSHQVMLCAMSGMSEASEASESSGSVRALPTSRVITLLQSAWGNCFSSTPSLLPAALARASLVLRQLELPPESTWGSPAGQRPAPRGNCSTQFPVCAVTTNVTVERWYFPLRSAGLSLFSGGSRSCLARP